MCQVIPPSVDTSKPTLSSDITRSQSGAMAMPAGVSGLRHSFIVLPNENNEKPQRWGHV